MTFGLRGTHQRPQQYSSPRIECDPLYDVEVHSGVKLGAKMSTDGCRTELYVQQQHMRTIGAEFIHNPQLKIDMSKMSTRTAGTCAVVLYWSSMQYSDALGMGVRTVPVIERIYDYAKHLYSMHTYQGRSVKRDN